MSDDDLQHTWHRAACQELEGRVEGRKFLIWVTVEPGQGEGGSAPTAPEDVNPQAWEAVAESVETWLESLNPATVDKDDQPRHDVRIADVRIEVSAAPKKSKRHGTGPLVANPFPGIATFTGSQTAGPAEPFDADN